MSREVTLDQFVSLAGIDFKDRLPGREVAVMFGFDPDKCKAEVNDHGMLTLSQEGSNTSFSAMPGFWEEIPPPDVGTRRDERGRKDD